MSAVGISIQRKPVATLLLGGMVVGTIDLLFAWRFWSRWGVTLADILRSIAAGWHGGASRDMGAVGAIVGAVSHYIIAVAFVVAYWVAGRRHPRLLTHPSLYGAIYGALLYVVMNFVVLPLSAAGMPSFSNKAWIASSVIVHVMLGIGCAWFSKSARDTRRVRPVSVLRPAP